MAIPVGTTARQLAFLARWLLAGVVVAGMLTWWWPGYRAWGAIIGGVLAVMALWLTCRTVACDRTVPGHPTYLALIGPAGVLVYHLAHTGLGTGSRAPNSVAGEINLSMCFHLFLLGLAVMLTQSLLPHAARHAYVLSACGAAMMGGVAAAAAWGRVGPAREAMAMVGFSGIGVWLSPLWGVAGGPGEIPHPLKRRRMRVACIGVAVAAAAVLTAIAPREGAAAAGVVAATLVLAGVLFRHRRKAFLLAGISVGCAAGIAVIATGPAWLRPQAAPAGLFGVGEEAFARVGGDADGLAILGLSVGWFGLAWLVAGLVACAVWLMGSGARRCRAPYPGDGGGQQAAGGDGFAGRAVVWTASTVLASLALLCPGGLFAPAVTLAAALTWGLMPAMLGRPMRARWGGWLLAAMVVLDLLLGLSSNAGLTERAALAFHGNDKLQHAVAGFLLAMMMAWLLGSRRTWLGLVGIVLAALAGGPGEVLQKYASRRHLEWADWAAHAVGAAAVVLPYLLAVGARWCESPDARPEGAQGRAETA